MNSVLCSSPWDSGGRSIEAIPPSGRDRPKNTGKLSHSRQDRFQELEDLEWWYLFHQQVAQLPVEEREVMGLVFDHGWTQAQVAELFQVSIRTVRRRWESTMVKLYGTLREGGTGTPETFG